MCEAYLASLFIEVSPRYLTLTTIIFHATGHAFTTLKKPIFYYRDVHDLDQSRMHLSML